MPRSTVCVGSAIALVLFGASGYYGYRLWKQRKKSSSSKTTRICGGRSRIEFKATWSRSTREVNNGEDALSAAVEFKPDLILLDAMMPKISGFDVLDILRNTPDTANIRIIMLTALSQPKDKERAESLGVDDYLVKSQVVIGDVVERVKHHLDIV